MATAPCFGTRRRAGKSAHSKPIGASFALARSFSERESAPDSSLSFRNRERQTLPAVVRKRCRRCGPSPRNAGEHDIISPYLFFWQAAQEVEEERSQGRNLAQRKGATDAELRRARIDVVTGMFASNFIMYFIILTTAATLHAHGATQIATARQAAEALRPLAGNAAYWLFTLGLIGTGTLGVPVLAGSSAYAIAEASAWRGSLAKKPRGARRFYAVLGAAMLGGLLINYLGLDAVKMMFWAAVINGALAPPLI